MRKGHERHFYKDIHMANKFIKMPDITNCKKLQLRTNVKSHRTPTVR